MIRNLYHRDMTSMCCWCVRITWKCAFLLICCSPSGLCLCYFCVLAQHMESLLVYERQFLLDLRYNVTDLCTPDYNGQNNFAPAAIGHSSSPVQSVSLPPTPQTLQASWWTWWLSRHTHASQSDALPKILSLLWPRLGLAKLTPDSWWTKLLF